MKKRRTERANALETSAFKKMSLHAHFALLPHCLDDVRVHIFELLQELLMRYHATLGGVPISLADITLAPGSKYGRIIDGDAHVHVDVRLNAHVFCPKVGHQIQARVNKAAPMFVGLLVHGLFNASIEKSEMAGLEFDENGERWRDDANLSVGVGALCVFEILKTHHNNGVFSLDGKFVRLLEAAPEAKA